MIMMNYILRVFIGSLLFLGGCATVPERVELPVDQTRSLKYLCSQNNIVYQWDPITQTVALKREALQANVLVGSDIVLLGEDIIRLSSPLEMKQSAIVIPPDFKEKVIERLR